MAWVNANLYRAKKLPKLSEITSHKDAPVDVGLKLKAALSEFTRKK